MSTESPFNLRIQQQSQIGEKRDNLRLVRDIKLFTSLFQHMLITLFLHGKLLAGRSNMSNMSRNVILWKWEWATRLWAMWNCFRSTNISPFLTLLAKSSNPSGRRLYSNSEKPIWSICASRRCHWYLLLMNRMEKRNKRGRDGRRRRSCRYSIFSILFRS